MIEITQGHINQLIEIESQVRYDTPPPSGEKPFIVVPKNSPVLLSAPHGAQTYRDSKKEKWHEEDEYTGGLAQLLGEICEVSVIATVYRNDEYDPNYVRNDNVAYKQEIRSLIENSGVKYVIDLHGAALKSTYLEPNQTIDIGFRCDAKHERSMAGRHIRYLEQCLKATEGKCDPSCFVVERNKLPARGRGTITSFVFCVFGLDSEHDVQAVQIEMKPQIRIVRRFSTASLYKSCGPYEADSSCIMHLLQSLADFINHLKNSVE